MTRMPALGGGDQGTPIAQKDAAETFDESDVIVTNNLTSSGGGSVSLTDTPPNVQAPGSFSTFSADGSSTGLRFVPKEDMAGIEVDVNAKISGNDSTLFINGSDISQQSKSYTPGDTVTFNLTLTAGTAYDIWIYEVSYTSVRTSASYPYEAATFDVTGSYNGGSTYWEVFDAIRDVDKVESGTAFIEFPAPEDIYRWDAATFTRTPDGETVTVNIEENDGTGWTEIAPDIGRGDDIDANPDSEVRFRIDIERTDMANNPTLDSIYRRWVV